LTSKHPLDNSQITGNREVIAVQKSINRLYTRVPARHFCGAGAMNRSFVNAVTIIGLLSIQRGRDVQYVSTSENRCAGSEGQGSRSGGTAEEDAASGEIHGKLQFWD
jgi:hypothetical protein